MRSSGRKLRGAPFVLHSLVDKSVTKDRGISAE